MNNLDRSCRRLIILVTVLDQGQRSTNAMKRVSDFVSDQRKQFTPEDKLIYLPFLPSLLNLPQGIRNALQELSALEWLGQIVHGTELDHLCGNFFVAESGHDNNGKVRIDSSEFPKYRRPICIR